MRRTKLRSGGILVVHQRLADEIESDLSILLAPVAATEWGPAPGLTSFPKTQHFAASASESPLASRGHALHRHSLLSKPPHLDSSPRLGVLIKRDVAS